MTTYNVLLANSFKGAAKPLAKKYKSLPDDLVELNKTLSERPESGILITENTYKIRMSITSKGKGKRGGARIIYYIVTQNLNVYLLDIYDKSDTDNISDKQLQYLINELKKEFDL